MNQCTYGWADRKRKEMFYLTIHSIHFIYGYMASEIKRQMNEWTEIDKGTV